MLQPGRGTTHHTLNGTKGKPTAFCLAENHRGPFFSANNTVGAIKRDADGETKKPSFVRLKSKYSCWKYHHLHHLPRPPLPTPVFAGMCVLVSPTPRHSLAALTPIPQHQRQVGQFPDYLEPLCARESGFILPASRNHTTKASTNATHVHTQGTALSDPHNSAPSHSHTHQLRSRHQPQTHRSRFAYVMKFDGGVDIVTERHANHNATQ